MEETKLQVLKTLYSQQQSTAHILRERMSKITSGAVGLFTVIDGWILTKETVLTRSHGVILIISLVVIFFVSAYALYARYREFSAVARLIVRIETAMEIYHPGVYLPDDSLYPAEFQNLGEDNYEHGRNIFLSQVYILIVFGVLSVGIALFV